MRWRWVRVTFAGCAARIGGAGTFVNTGDSQFDVELDTTIPFPWLSGVGGSDWACEDECEHRNDWAHEEDHCFACAPTVWVNASCTLGS